MATIVAPIPAFPSAGLRARRGMTTGPMSQTEAIQAATPERTPVRTMAPIAYAQSQFKETGNPLQAMAQGFVNATNMAQEQDARQAALEEAAKALDGQPDLQRYVRNGIMEPTDAVRISEARKAKATETEQANTRRTQIAQLLAADPDPEVQRLAEPFAAGALDENEVWDVLKPVKSTEKPPSGYRRTENGDLEAIPGGPADKGQREAPPGYRWTDTGEMEAIPGGPADKSGTGRKLSVAEIKELFETDEAVESGQNVVEALGRAIELNKTAWDGPLADIGTQAGALVGDANSVDTQELKNLVTAQALDQLRATFGAMPTEGERKILLEIQGSINQPRGVRERIFARAKRMAERRIAYNERKAAAIRDGSYFEGGVPAYDDMSEGATDASINGVPDAAIPASPTEAPPDLDPAIWEEMTAEERALWN